MKGDYIKRAKVNPASTHTSRVVFYDTKVKATAPPPAMVPVETITPILQELLAWQRKVNQRLKRMPTDAAPPAAPTFPTNTTTAAITTPTTTTPPTLYVRFKEFRQGNIYSIPDRILGRSVGIMPGNQTVALYEPWTENDQGLWMRCGSGGWVQLWDRTTGTFFAD